MHDGARMPPGPAPPMQRRCLLLAHQRSKHPANPVLWAPDAADWCRPDTELGAACVTKRIKRKAEKGGPD